MLLSKNTLAVSAAMVVFWALIPPALSMDGIHERVSACAKIRSDNRRLACFDELTAQELQAASATRAAAAPNPDPAPKPTPVVSPTEAVSPQPPVEAGSTPATVSTIITEGDFGLENRRVDEGIQEITSRYDGDFTGWSGKTLFRLENGQVWKQAQSGRVSYRASRPVITIERGALGSFRLKVEGLNRTVRVTRIK